MREETIGMKAEKPAPEAAAAAKPARRRRWRELVLVAAIVGVVVALLVLSRPNGVTYEEYLQLKPGMSRETVSGIIGQADYWHYPEGDKDITKWVNKDGTYIRTVFDKNDVLLEMSWESGWVPPKDAED
jgi:hypothetical protein